MITDRIFEVITNSSFKPRTLIRKFLRNMTGTSLWHKIRDRKLFYIFILTLCNILILYFIYFLKLEFIDYNHFKIRPYFLNLFQHDEIVPDVEFFSVVVKSSHKNLIQELERFQTFIWIVEIHFHSRVRSQRFRR